MPPFHHSKIIPELMENAGCELWYLPQYSRLFQPHRGGKKLRLQFEKSYLNTTFMFIEPPMRCFRSCKYFAAHCCTPLRDIPQSIEVVPEQVIEDQQATDLREVTRNVSGVIQANTFGNALDRFLIRGFEQSVFLQNGFRDPTQQVRDTGNLERVEVLKGPASLLYGTLEPGGIINLVTKKPLQDPFYSIKTQVGSFNTFESSIDFSGPLNDNKTLLYRLNELYKNRDVFRNFDQEVERTSVQDKSWKSEQEKGFMELLATP